MNKKLSHIFSAADGDDHGGNDDDDNRNSNERDNMGDPDRHGRLQEGHAGGGHRTRRWRISRRDRVCEGVHERQRHDRGRIGSATILGTTIFVIIISHVASALPILVVPDRPHRLPISRRARAFLDELKQINNQVTSGKPSLSLSATGATSREQRALRATEQIQEFMKDGDSDKPKQAYQTICWRSMTAVHDMHRACSLEKNSEMQWYKECSGRTRSNTSGRRCIARGRRWRSND